MVQLEEVEDQELSAAQPGPVHDEDDEEYDSADFVDTDSEISEGSLPPPSDETLSERLLALRDIIPPPQRAYIASVSSTLYSAATTTLSLGGKTLWIVSTASMMIMVPFAIAFVEEQAIVEQEREMKGREALGEGVTPGVGVGGAAAGAGTAL